MSGSGGGSARTGKTGEDIAAAFLASRGMDLVQKNYRVKGAEIDLIMRDGEQLVFVEVKTRHYATEMSAYDAVSLAKQKRISKAAACFLQENAHFETFCRFDVVIIIGAFPDTTVEHYKNAFPFAAKNIFL